VFPGTFRQTKCFDGSTAQDPGWVYQELRRVQAPANEIALSLLPSLITSEEAIVRPFGFTSGKKWDKALVFYDLNPNSRATVEAFTAAELVSKLAGSGWTYADRKWQESDDNTAIFVVLFQKVAWTATFAANKRTVSEQNPNDTEENTITQEATGISEANLAASYAAAKVSESGRVVEAVSKSEGSDGERIVRNVMGAVNEKGDGDPANSDAITIELTPEIGTKGATATRRWKRVSKAYKDALVASAGLARSAFVVPETGATSYSSVSTSITDHGNYVYSVTQSGQVLSYSQWDTYVDTRGKPVYRKVVTSSTDTNPQLFVKWPIYRHSHVFRATWSAAFFAAKAKQGAVTPSAPVGQYPIIGEVRVSGFGSWFYHGEVTTFRGWYPKDTWQNVTDEPIDTAAPAPDPDE
jgi:hypothetical protein